MRDENQRLKAISAEIVIKAADARQKIEAQLSAIDHQRHQRFLNEVQGLQADWRKLIRFNIVGLITTLSLAALLWKSLGLLAPFVVIPLATPLAIQFAFWATRLWLQGDPSDELLRAKRN